MLAGDLQPHRALAGDDVGIVERVDEDRAGLVFQLSRMSIGGVETVAMQHDVAAQRADGGDLDARRGGRHDDGGGRVATRRRQGHALRVIAGRGADDPSRQFAFGHAGDLVVGAADLEREDGLQVLALQEDGPLQPRRQATQGIERGLLRHVIDAGGQDAADGVLHANIEKALKSETKRAFV